MAVIKFMIALKFVTQGRLSGITSVDKSGVTVSFKHNCLHKIPQYATQIHRPKKSISETTVCLSLHIVAHSTIGMTIVIKSTRNGSQVTSFNGANTFWVMKYVKTAHREVDRNNPIIAGNITCRTSAAVVPLWFCINCSW
jgi:hypothetical protein